MSAPLYLALLHHPVVNREGVVVTTSVTNLDIHDIARSARTYDVAGYYVAHPNPGLRALCERVAWHWKEGYGARTHPSRRDAMGLVHVVSDLDQVVTSIEKRAGVLPIRVATSARAHDRETISCVDLRDRREKNPTPILIVLGTGYGLTPELVAECELLIEPLGGPGDYNHLSVRSAAAILLDRLCGTR